MIEVEINNCPDPLATGNYKFNFDAIYIGRSKKADLIFSDREVPLLFLTIEIIQNQLVIKNHSKSPFYFVNGKKISGGYKLKCGDKINFGKNQITVNAYQTTEEVFSFDIDLEASDPSVRHYIDILQQKINALEKKQNV